MIIIHLFRDIRFWWRTVSHFVWLGYLLWLIWLSRPSWLFSCFHNLHHQLLHGTVHDHGWAGGGRWFSLFFRLAMWIRVSTGHRIHGIASWSLWSSAWSCCSLLVMTLFSINDFNSLGRWVRYQNRPYDWDQRHHFCHACISSERHQLEHHDHDIDSPSPKMPLFCRFRYNIGSSYHSPPYAIPHDAWFGINSNIYIGFWLVVMMGSIRSILAICFLMSIVVTSWDDDVVGIIGEQVGTVNHDDRWHRDRQFRCSWG